MSNVLKESINLLKRMGEFDGNEVIYEIKEPLGTYNSARYLSFKITEDKTILKEEVDWEVPENEKGGIITLSTDVNAVELHDNKVLNKIKQFLLTWKQRLQHRDMIDSIAKKHKLVGWTIGKFLEGRYTAKNGVTFGENSLSIECVGVTSEELLDVAKDLCHDFNQESVLVKDYSTGKILFVNAK